MTAQSILQCARDLGIRFFVEGDNLIVEADTEPPAEVITAITALKPEIIRHLTRLEASSDWTAEDWRFLFDERAADAEHDQRMTRIDAEAVAFECCVIAWLTRSPVASVPGRCLWCGHRESAGRDLLPFGAEPALRVWLHDDCWPRWRQQRRDEAVQALAEMGIHAPDPAAGEAA